MRIFFVVILGLFLSSVQSYCQSQRYTIVWDENGLSQQDLIFEKAVVNPEVEGLYLYRNTLDIPQNKEVKNFEIVVLDSRNIDLNGKVLSNYPTKFEPFAESFTIKKNKSWIFSFVPYRIIGGSTIELVTLFEVKYTLVDVAYNNNRGPLTTTESVLMEGDIYKIQVDRSGVFKIDKAFLESKLGIDISKIDPKKLKIYGNGGGRLPESNADFRYDDLIENRIFVEGENDNKFDNNDFILFYAEGPDVLKFNETTKRHNFDKNIYDNFNYYFLKTTGNPGLRIVTATIPSATPTFETDQYEYIKRYEVDRINLLGANAATHGTGKEWYGDYFKVTRERDYSSEFDFTDINITKPVQVNMLFAGRSSNTSSVQLLLGGQTISKNISGVSISDVESRYAGKAIFNESLILNSANPKVTVRYPTSSSENEGWLDYLQLTFFKKLRIGSGQIFFRNTETITHEVASFIVDSNQQIWDVTNPIAPVLYNIFNNKLIFNTGSTCREFIAHNGSVDALIPLGGGKIINQNLHGLENQDMLVVYHPAFESAAKKFADHRSKHSTLNVASVDINMVYNEFSSGKIDPTAIRDMAKMLYDRGSTFKYLLLMGDGSYDYKGIMPNLSMENFIPVYETDESMDPISGFPADDYFGLLDDDEGINLRGGIDVAVGRIPVKSNTEAENIVNKIIHYDTSPSTLGDWRLRIGFAADDEDFNRHLIDSDEIARKVENSDPIFNQQKVYFDAFPQVSTAGDPRYPEANKRLNENVFFGQLTNTYLGHGGPQGWAQERVLTLKDIKGWTNIDKLFLMVTATCSFAAYDDPKIVSPGEESLLNPKGGAIALFSTTRAVFTNSNKELTDAVHKIMYKKVNGIPLTFGEILMEGKNQNPGLGFLTNSRKFTLLGDPSQKIAIPKHNINITKVNNKPLSEVTDTLKSLTFVEIEGEVVDESQKVLENFNGTLNSTIFDKKSNLRTLGNDVRSPIFNFGNYTNIIFKGTATVKNGLWKFGFWVPKDINYDIGYGRVSLYASDGISQDAGGYSHELKIGGSNNASFVDDQGPEIDIFMNDESFVFGGITNESPILLLNLRDDFGINVTGTAIGHDITAILDENTQDALVLNDYYEAAKDDHTSGVVRYPLTKLSKGKHTITAKAWDISNNSAEKRTEFLVVGSENEILERVLNYPNPFSTNTKFQFEHDLANTTLDVTVYIYSVSGKLVKTVQQSNYYSGNRVTDVEWNGRDDYESKLARGVYLYKIVAHARDLNIIRESGFEKLVIL